ncbi:hypothetical protein QFZ43_004414 [Streptomyces afghaniensis]|nr:hypothetical protein [Streptomyces afghaniensis]
MEEDRLLALRGRYEGVLPLLEEALSFGRPRSAVLLNQLRHLLAPRGSWDYGNLVADQRHLQEILPVEAMRPATGEWRPAARGAAREMAEAVPRTMRDGTHRYAPPGPWAGPSPKPGSWPAGGRPIGRCCGEPHIPISQKAKAFRHRCPSAVQRLVRDSSR